MLAFKRWRKLLVLFGAIPFFLQVGVAQDISQIELEVSTGHPRFGALRVSHLPIALLKMTSGTTWDQQQWRQVFPVYINGNPALSESGVPPMLGHYDLVEDTLWFRPRMPFIEGRSYRARFNPTASGNLPANGQEWPKAVTEIIDIPRRTALTQAGVTAVYPSGPSVPANLLKFYIEFSAPMRSGEALDHLRLVDEKGQIIGVPFLRIEQELWDPANRRLTVWFDPGRIKRGLSPNRALGLPMQVGTTYRLIIDAAWRDANGQPLSKTYTQTWTAASPDRSRPDTAQWNLHLPPAGSRDALMVQFPEPMDYALLQSLLQVVDDRGREVEGTVAVKNNEQSWILTPSRPWGAGAYSLQVDTDLEDLAGNNLRRLFDKDLSRPQPSSSVGRIIEVNFELH